MKITIFRFTDNTDKGGSYEETELATIELSYFPDGDMDIRTTMNILVRIRE